MFGLVTMSIESAKEFGSAAQWNHRDGFVCVTDRPKKELRKPGHRSAAQTNR